MHIGPLAKLEIGQRQLIYIAQWNQHQNDLIMNVIDHTDKNTQHIHKKYKHN
jgi:hypothetical protein